MQFKEAKSVLAIGAILAFRMLGLFMILPVFSYAAMHIKGSNATLIGMAIGAYGLTQACFQVPFGAMSDRLGRKPVIAAGLALFAIGSCVAAMSTHMVGLIIGRAIQGSGAIGSTCIALVADLTRDESRTKSMAIVGMTIGLSFCLAIVLGPLVYTHFHLSGIFWLTALLALTAFVLLYIAVPNPPRSFASAQEITPEDYRKVFTHSELLRINFSIFVQHAILTLLFISLPILYAHNNITTHTQTLLYLVVISLAFIAMLPFVIIGEVKRKLKGVFLFAIIAIGASQYAAYDWQFSITNIGIILFFFFMAFTLLESILPSLVSKIAPLNLKGTAIGVYSTCQYIGIFLGGTVGGVVLHYYNTSGLFILNGSLCIVWLLIMIGMKQPPYFSTLIIQKNNGELPGTFKTELLRHPGVKDIYVSAREHLVYIKADKTLIDENKLRNAVEKDTLKDLQ